MPAPPYRRNAPDEVKYCNCSLCGQECVGDSTDRRMLTPATARLPFIAIRVNGRPRCNRCIARDYDAVSNKPVERKLGPRIFKAPEWIVET